MEMYDVKIKLQGRVIRIAKNEKLSSIVVETTSAPGDRSKKNCPQVIVFEPSMLEGVEKGDFVYVEATSQSFYQKNRDGEKKRTQSIVATKIEPAKSRLENAYGTVKGDMYERINEVIIVGTLLSAVEQPSGMTYVSVRVVENGHVNTLLLKFHNNSYTKKKAEQFKVGDTIYASGTIQTRFHEAEGRPRVFFQDFIISECNIQPHEAA